MAVTKIRVGIVEDDAHLRADFSRLVNQAGDMTSVGAFATAEEALAVVPAEPPDVVLMDINLPGLSGIECAGRLHAAVPQMHIVMLAAFEESERVFESLKAGATGYVLKRAPAPEILDAVRDVCAGGAPMTSTIARKVVQFFSKRMPAPEIQTLTDRERAVLAALSEGQQYKEIADTLGISINTVRKHIKSTYEKLHVNTRLDAVTKFGRL